MRLSGDRHEAELLSRTHDRFDGRDKEEVSVLWNSLEEFRHKLVAHAVTAKTLPDPDGTELVPEWIATAPEGRVRKDRPVSDEFFGLADNGTSCVVPTC